ncbi:MAG: hypothetical protein K2W95_11830 [Candidatus Obscuribacterales bacterium]|nr:hypothetical protein [Candidatus Obscuribacterales bacterium]
MMDDFYTSEFGWQWVLPEGFERIDTLRSNDMYGVSRSAVFSSKQHSEVHLSWSVLNGPPVDYATDARFKAIISDRAPINAERLIDVLSGIMPITGVPKETSCVRLPDNTDAVELITEQQLKNIDEQQMHYILLFPLEPAATDRGANFAYNSSTQFVDPITNQLIVLSPVLLGERVSPETGDVCQVYQLGHDRYQRIIMSARRSDFEEILSEVRRAAHGFHYKTKPRPIRDSWPDATRLYQDAMSDSFEALKNPPAGLTDQDIAVLRNQL